MTYWGTIVSAAIGAFCAHFAAEYVRSLTRFAQALEDERDNDLDYILTTVDNVMNSAIRYWTHDAEELGRDDRIIAETIVAGQHALSCRIELLFSKNLSQRDFSLDEVRHFMTAATEGDFMNPEGDFMNPERKADPGKIRGVISSAEILRHGVRFRRRKLPRKHFAWLRK